MRLHRDDVRRVRQLLSTLQMMADTQKKIALRLIALEKRVRKEADQVVALEWNVRKGPSLVSEAPVHPTIHVGAMVRDVGTGLNGRVVAILPDGRAVFDEWR